MNRLIPFVIGFLSAVLYGYLKWNVDGYWYGIPLVILTICLLIGD